MTTQPTTQSPAQPPTSRLELPREPVDGYEVIWFERDGVRVQARRAVYFVNTSWAAYSGREERGAPLVDDWMMFWEDPDGELDAGRRWRPSGRLTGWLGLLTWWDRADGHHRRFLDERSARLDQLRRLDTKELACVEDYARCCRLRAETGMRLLELGESKRLASDDQARRGELLQRMAQASERTYWSFFTADFGSTCHAFIEFNGLLSKFVQLCGRAHEQGVDFTMANTHSGTALPMKAHDAAYIGEKLDCIFGPALRANPKAMAAFLAVIQGEGKDR